MSRHALARMVGTLIGIAVVAAVAAASETVHVGSRPAPIRRKPNPRADIVVTMPAGSALQAFDRDGNWLWVVAPVEGGATRAGWISVQALRANDAAAPVAPAPPVAQAGTAAAALAFNDPDGRPWAASSGPSALPSGNETVIAGRRSMSLVEVADAARMASAAAATARAERAGASTTGRGGRSGPGTGSGEPPVPIGGVPRERRSLIGEWIMPRTLRASFAFGYQSAYVRQALGSLDERLRGGGATLATSFAVLDPRILTVDFSGDLQFSRTTSEASLASFRNTSGLRSYRLDFGILSGLSAPLRLYADRLSSTSDLRPFGETLDPERRTRGVRRDAGFIWDVNVPRLPRIQVSASTGRQLDERNYVFGYSSTNDERRAEVRASRDYALGRYELDFTHGAFVYDVPEAGVRSETGSDILQGTARLTPFSRLALDLHARASRFQFGVGGQDSRVSGAGADLSGSYRLGEHLSASGRYSFSNNAFEAALSGRLAPSQPGAAPVTTTAQLRTRTLFQDGEARLEYATRPFTGAAVVKSVSFGVPAYEATTLAALVTAGGLVRAEHSWHALSLHAGADGSAGRARSNRGAEQQYRDAGVDAGVSHDLAGRIRFGLDGGIRRVARLAFFPVNLEARNASVRLETMRPGWARLHATVTRFDNLRDVLYSDSRDRHTGYSLGLSSQWYDVSADIDQTDTHSLLLAPGILGSRPDVAILIASRPELFRNLLAATDHTRLFALQLRPWSGLQLQGRVRRQEQSYPGLFGFRLRGAQAWASYQLREVQLEFGWEYFDSWTSFGNVRDRRLYFRVRRDLTFF